MHNRFMNFLPAASLLLLLGAQAASAGSTTPIDVATWERGEKLYSLYCASCHAPLASTRVPDRRSTRIRSAINQLGIMADLKHLSDADLDAIAKVLRSDVQVSAVAPAPLPVSAQR